jgi:hypothetical protein
VTFKPRIWYPIAVGLSLVNLGAIWFAARPAEPWHATIHGVLALAFGLWAQRLRQRRGPPGLPPQVDALEAYEGLEADVNRLQQELIETQERLDFAERVLAQGQEPRSEQPK